MDTIRPPAGAPPASTAVDQEERIHALERQNALLASRNATLEQSAAAAEAERRRLQAVLDAMPAGIAIHGTNGKLVAANEQFGRIWAGGKPLPDLAPAPDRDWPRLAWWPETRELLAPEEWAAARALHRGEAVPGQLVEIERLDGTSGAVLESAQALRDGAGRVVGAVSVIVDVSERLRAERRLRLEDRRKDEFLAVLSHELRNPLAPIRNSIHVLEHVAPGSEQARRAISVIDRQVAQLTHIVEDLLDVTRIARGKVKLQRERVDLAAIVARTVDDYRSHFDAAGVALEARLPGGALWTNGDATRLAQVLGNLLQNAARYTPRGGRTVVTLRRTDGAAAIRVRDTGVGIAPALLERVFEPFVQLDANGPRGGGGLGLGLALVKSLVALHGGEVVARSDGQDQGTEFTILLPLEAASAASGGAAGESGAPTRTTAGRPDRSILLIEDEPDAAATLREALQLDGYQVTVACDGAEGVRLARALRPALVLCDVGLPGMNGYAVAQALLADEGLRGTKLVALTGRATAEERQRLAAAGFDAHLAKPAAVQEIERLIDELEERSRP